MSEYDECEKIKYVWSYLNFKCYASEIHTFSPQTSNSRCYTILSVKLKKYNLYN